MSALKARLALARRARPGDAGLAAARDRPSRLRLPARSRRLRGQSHRGQRLPATDAGSHPYALTHQGRFQARRLRAVHRWRRQGPAPRPATWVAAQPDRGRPVLASRSSLTPRISPFQESESGESCPDRARSGRSPCKPPSAVARPGPSASSTSRRRPVLPPSSARSPTGCRSCSRRGCGKRAATYGLSLEAKDISQQLNLDGFELALWGNPWLVAHDKERGELPERGRSRARLRDRCGAGTRTADLPADAHSPGPARSATRKPTRPTPILTLPASCDGPLAFAVSASSWQQPAHGQRQRRARPSPRRLRRPLASPPNARPSPRTDRTTSASGLRLQPRRSTRTGC